MALHAIESSQNRIRDFRGVEMIALAYRGARAILPS